VNAVLLRSLPYGDAGRLVYLYATNSHLHFPPNAFGPSYADFYDLKRANHSFSNMTIFEQVRYSLASQDSAARVGGARVDASFFSTLASRPELGRMIDSQDNQPGHEKVAIISHALWQNTFGGGAEVLTKSLLLNGRSYRIIGVMPLDFQYPHDTDFAYSDPGVQATEVWVPIALSPQQEANRQGSDAYAIGRLRPGVSVMQAQAEVSALMASLDLLHTDMKGWGAFIEPLRESAEGTSRHLIWLLLGAVLFVLLIACGNAANLLLAHAAVRSHELGVRAVLGAGRTRIVRQMLTESLLLGLAGGFVGVLLAYASLRGLLRLAPGNIPRLNTASLDARVLLFTAMVAVFTSLLFGILPALSVSHINLVEFLKTRGTGGAIRWRSRLQSRLVVAEVGLTVVLLSGAGLLMRSYVNVASINTGFSQSAVSMNIQLDGLYSQPRQRLAVLQNIMDKIKAIPGVRMVGAINTLPLSNSNFFQRFWLDGYENQADQLVEFRTVTSEYFSAMDIPLMQGRLFTAKDGSGHAAEVIVNQAFARKYLRDRDPIGRYVTTGKRDNPPTMIVGVVADVRHSSLEAEPPPEIYSAWPNDAQGAYICVRSALQPQEVASAVRSTLRTVDPSLAIADIHPMSELVSEATAKRRFQTTLLIFFAGAALFLSMVGLYGLLTYLVKQRTAEIGVRMALGASRFRVLSMVLVRGLRLVAVGVILGLAGALALTRVLISSLYGVQAFDPVTFLAVPAALLLATVFAALIPGLRAARMEPVNALRYE
jgi:predicted permease